VPAGRCRRTFAHGAFLIGATPPDGRAQWLDAVRATHR
jgi:hypothetical protein